MSTLPDLPPLPEGMSTDLQAWFDYRSPDEVREALRAYALEAMQIGRRAGLEEAAKDADERVRLWAVRAIRSLGG